MTLLAIIDDHEVLAETLAFALSEVDGTEVFIASPDDEDDIAAVLRDGPDLCLLDLDFGSQGGAGIDLLPQLIQARIDTVVFTGSENEAMFGRCIELGALGVIPKALPFGAVVALVHTALRGEPVNEQADKYDWILAANHERSVHEQLTEPFTRLTTSEAAVLGLLMDGQLVAEIGSARCVSERTVRSQIRSILQKLGVNSQLAAVAAAHRAEWSPPETHSEVGV